MKTLDLSMAAVIAGVLGASFAACSAQSSGTPPRNDGSGGTTGTTTGGTGTGNTGNVGTGNTGNVGTGNTGNVGTGTGGTGTGTAGTGTGTAGTGTGTAGTGTGTGGDTGVMSCGTLTKSATDPACCVASGTAADLAIDSLEDGDNTILPIGNRQGYWYTYNDMAGATQMPLPSATFTPTAGGNPCSLMPVPGACAGPTGGVLWSAETSGMLTANAPPSYKFAGMGFDFNNHFKKSCAYGASAYHGISFYTKGNAQFAIQVKIPATTAMNALAAGTCATLCDDNYAKLVTPTAAWAQVSVMFTDPMFKQAGFGTPVTFDGSNLIGVQFQVAGSTTAVPFDFAIDDVAFLP